MQTSIQTKPMSGSTAGGTARWFTATGAQTLTRLVSTTFGDVGDVALGGAVGTHSAELNFYMGISEREANAVWKEALYNPDVARQLSVAAKGGTATPMQLERMHNYLLAVGLHDARESSRSQP
jgi:hypothetical protein